MNIKTAILLLFNLFSFCLMLPANNNADLSKQEILFGHSQKAERDNIIAAFLPIYGSAKLNKAITQKNLNDIKKVFEKDPRHWDELMIGFASVHVFLPELIASNWTFEKYQFDRVHDIFGVDAVLADLFDDDYLEELSSKCFDDLDTNVFLLQLAAHFGAIVGHNAEWNSFKNVFEELVLDSEITVALLPTLTSILLVALLSSGKRDVNQLFEWFGNLHGIIPQGALNQLQYSQDALGVVLPRFF